MWNKIGKIATPSQTGSEKHQLSDELALAHKQRIFMLQNVAGPSPWYLHESASQLTWRGSVLYWKPRKDNPKTDLVDAQGQILGSVSYYVYIQRLEGSKFSVWNGSTLRLYDADLLAPFSSVDEADAQYEKSRLSYCFNTQPLASIMINTTVEGPEHIMQFPKPFEESIEEMLLLSGGYALEIFPRNTFVRSTRLSWFLDADLDYGHQWITRIVRDPVTRKVIGDGIRIPSFTLNNEMTMVEEPTNWLRLAKHF